jgi:hypothetical protein
MYHLLITKMNIINNYNFSITWLWPANRRVGKLLMTKWTVAYFSGRHFVLKVVSFLHDIITNIAFILIWTSLEDIIYIINCFSSRICMRLLLNIENSAFVHSVSRDNVNCHCNVVNLLKVILLSEWRNSSL